jgi:hypothetical protein
MLSNSNSFSDGNSYGENSGDHEPWIFGAVSSHL